MQAPCNTDVLDGTRVVDVVGTSDDCAEEPLDVVRLGIDLVNGKRQVELGSPWHGVAVFNVASVRQTVFVVGFQRHRQPLWGTSGVGWGWGVEVLPVPSADPLAEASNAESPRTTVLVFCLQRRDQGAIRVFGTQGLDVIDSFCLRHGDAVRS